MSLIHSQNQRFLKQWLKYLNLSYRQQWCQYQKLELYVTVKTISENLSVSVVVIGKFSMTAYPSLFLHKNLTFHQNYFRFVKAPYTSMCTRNALSCVRIYKIKRPRVSVSPENSSWVNANSLFSSVKYVVDK